MKGRGEYPSVNLVEFDSHNATIVVDLMLSLLMVGFSTISLKLASRRAAVAP
ncbi:MAG: hypothetical protein OXD01_03285 [Gammaproteobacteria bacterium]|nr:hypothetical protein [Gammaproteobacteria bacterium]